jgi:hypothetical protein
VNVLLEGWGSWRACGRRWNNVGPQPNDRPSIKDVLQCLEAVSNLSEPHFPGVDEEVEEDGEDWDSASDFSDVPDEASGTMKTEGDKTTSSDHSSSPASTAPGPSTVKPSDGVNAGSLPLVISDFDSNGGGTYQASTI